MNDNSRQPALSLSSIVQVAESLISRFIGDEVAILHPTSELCYTLNSTGARIWSLLSEPQTVQEVRDVLMGEYGIAAPACEADLLALLEALRAAELIQVLPAPSSEAAGSADANPEVNPEACAQENPVSTPPPASGP